MFLSGEHSPSWEDIARQAAQTGVDYLGGRVYDHGGAPPYPGYYYPTGAPQTPEVVVVDQQQTGTGQLIRYGAYAAAGLLALRALGAF